MPATGRKMTILFLCGGNSCRSQMAEGWARRLRPESIEPYSAGLEARGLDPRAVTVMAEAGVDISGQRSKTLEAVRDIPFDLVVTLCGYARERCPIFLGPARVAHRGFDDPPAAALWAETEDQIMAPYRRVRDQIRRFVEGLPESLNPDPGADDRPEP